MSVAVVVPWQPGCPHREANLACVTARYDLPVVLGELQSDVEWCKAAAVANGLEQTAADVLVIADSDCIPPDTLSEAVLAVENGEPWAMPHRKVYRLNEACTAVVRGGEDVDHRHARLDRRPYEGVKAGGILVIRRDVYTDCPFDPRFVGWGGEDEALGRALNLLHGPVHRLDADLIHLWHPWKEHGMSRDTMRLVARYKGAFRKQDTAAMRQLIEEARSCLSPR
jgi:hypothetical protein